MPELPEVETVVRGLRPLLERQRLDRLLLRREDMRFPFPVDLSQRLTGKTIGAIERRAKYGPIRFPEDEEAPLTLLFHLGMSGRMVCVTPPDEDFDKHDHVVFQTAKGQVRFNDPRRFGFVEMYSGPDSASRFLDQLGPEPLSEALNPGHLRAVFKDKSAPIKASLLNQRLIAGLGNIYVCEALFEPASGQPVPPVRLSVAKSSDCARKSRPCWSGRSTRAASSYATTGRCRANSGTSSTPGGSTAARTNPAAPASGRSNASCSRIARHSSALLVSDRSLALRSAVFGPIAALNL